MKYTTMMRIGIVYFFVLVGTYGTWWLGDMTPFFYGGIASFGIAGLIAITWIKKGLRFIVKNKLLCISVLSFMIAGCFCVHLFLVVAGNAYATKHPDGLPITIPWGSIIYMTTFIIAGIITSPGISLLETKKFLRENSVVYYL